TVPFTLLNNSADTRYLAQSGLLSSNGPDTSKGQGVYTAEKSSYTLDDNQNTLAVKLKWKGQDGLVVTKTYTFQRDNYEIDVDYYFSTASHPSWYGNLYLPLLRKTTPTENHKGFMNLATYFGAAVSSPEDPFNKIIYNKMLESPFSQDIKGGWAAMIH